MMDNGEGLIDHPFLIFPNQTMICWTKSQGRACCRGNAWVVDVSFTTSELSVEDRNSLMLLCATQFSCANLGG